MTHTEGHEAETSAGRIRREMQPVIQEQAIKRLRLAYDLMEPTRLFKLGDIVAQLEELKFWENPAPGQACIVTGIEPGQLYSGEAGEYITFKMPSDLRVACYMPDGTLLEFWVDARRFTLVERQ